MLHRLFWLALSTMMSEASRRYVSWMCANTSFHEPRVACKYKYNEKCTSLSDHVSLTEAPYLECKHWCLREGELSPQFRGLASEGPHPMLSSGAINQRVDELISHDRDWAPTLLKDLLC